MCMCAGETFNCVYVCILVCVGSASVCVCVCTFVCVCVRAHVGREEILGRGPTSRRKSSLNMAFVG